MPNHTLIDSDDSILIVIDVQAAFLDKLPTAERSPLLSRICWLIGAATWLQIPLVLTAEDIPSLGGVAPEIAHMAPQTPAHNKMVFGLASDPDILGAVARTGRQTAVIVGLETDVCVAQSALGLIEHGYRVVAVADATGSPGAAHRAGLDRMRDAGVLIVNVKNLYYEWLRTVERAHRFRLECAHLPVPDGMQL